MEGPLVSQHHDAQEGEPREIDVRGMRSMRLAFVVSVIIVSFSASIVADSPVRPNVLWFVVDDMSANFSCYGETAVATPNVDRLAREGIRFANAHVTAPVCSTCRSAFMTGMYQASIASHHHRMTGPPIRLPAEVVPLPKLFQEAGYYTCNGDALRNPGGKVRKKTDYNFVWDESMYDGVDWSGRKNGQPFFMQVQMAGGKLRGGTTESFAANLRRAKEVFGDNVETSVVKLPPYYPEDMLLRQDWQSYLEAVRLTDHHVGQVLARLEDEGILDETLIVFMTDHGISHARGKQFNYNEGTHIPFVVRGPGVASGKVRTDLVEHIDMAAISLTAAGLPLPASMQARDILSKDYQPRDAAFAARDRCDETIDFIRSVRTERFLYIRNYNPFRPYLQPSRYKDNKDLLKRLRQLRNAGALTATQQRLLFSHSRAGEELYDVTADPYETNNLADDSAYENDLVRMRGLLDRHLIQTRDAGFIPEPRIAEISGAGRRTVFEFCQDAHDYPLGDIVELANLATQKGRSTADRFRRELGNENPIMRYWATVGLRVRGDDAAAAEPDLRRQLQDPDESVRIGAAMALAAMGQPGRAGRLLLEEARSAGNDAHALWALDGIKYLDAPHLITGFNDSQLVKGQYSGRAFHYLSKGGLVFGDGVDYWNP